MVIIGENEESVSPCQAVQGSLMFVVHIKAFLAPIRLTLNSLPGTNALAYLAQWLLKEKISNNSSPYLG
jgi:hypothetical protein